MPRRVPIPAQFRSAPFSVNDGRAAGLSRGRMRSADLDTPFRGVRVLAPARPDADERSTDQKLRDEVVAACVAYSTRMSPAQAFSHLTAARLYGLRVRARAALPLDVGTIAPSRAPRLRGVRGHTLQPDTAIRTSASGMRVTSPIETWSALAESLSLDELIEIGDGLVRRKRPLATMEQLAAAVVACAGRPGVKKLRAAFDDVRPGTDSLRETRLRLMVVRAGFPEPEVNARIENQYGAFVAFVDLLFRREKVVLEYDGGQHRENEKQFHRDIDRLDDLMELDFRVIRVNKSLMARPPTLFGKIRTALAR